MTQPQTFTDRVRAIGIADSQFIIIGSGLLEVLGLRKAGDVDAVLTQEAFDTLVNANNGEWQQGILPSGSPYLKKDGYELWTDWALDGSGHPDYQDLLGSSIEIEGIRYVTPEYLRVRKLESARPHDLTDVKLLDDYLARQKEMHHA